MKQFTDDNKVLIILPVHNEASNLEDFLPNFVPIAQDLNADILAIDDYSSDNSVNLLASYQIPTISHIAQMGYGIAIQTGYKYALRNDYDYVIQIDGDGQHDPRFLHPILDHLKKGAGDIIVGSRFLPVTDQQLTPWKKLYKGSPVRRIGIYLFRAILRILTAQKISDPTTGFIGYNRKVIRFLCSNCFSFDFPDADMFLILIRNHFKIKEIPVYMYPNHNTGYLHRGCKPIWYVFKVTLSLLISSIRSRET